MPDWRAIARQKLGPLALKTRRQEEIVLELAGHLEDLYSDAIRQGRMSSWDDLKDAIVFGAVKRLRPKVMTVACMLFGLLPIMWSIGSGADVMKRIAAPMVGGILTSFLMELIVYPPIFAIWKWNFEVKPTMRRTMPQQLRPMIIEEKTYV